MTMELRPHRGRRGGQLGKPTHASSGRKAGEGDLTRPVRHIFPGPSEVEGPGSL